MQIMWIVIFRIMSFMNVDYDKKESKRKKYDKKNTENSNKILKVKG